MYICIYIPLSLYIYVYAYIHIHFYSAPCAFPKEFTGTSTTNENECRKFSSVLKSSGRIDGHGHRWTVHNHLFVLTIGCWLIHANTPSKKTQNKIKQTPPTKNITLRTEPNNIVYFAGAICRQRAKYQGFNESGRGGLIVTKYRREGDVKIGWEHA